MGTRQGIVQSDEATKEKILGISDIDAPATLLGLVQTNEVLENGRVERSKIVEFYNNGIRFPPTIFFP